MSNGTGPVAVGVNLYPWDVVGDPACAERVASLGADRATLAAAYHTVRALTPQHPEHKVVTAPHSAIYYPPSRGRWMSKRIQPTEAYWAPHSFSAAAADLRAAGLKVYAWTVLAHNQRLGTIHADSAVTNAYGDKYPWALCIENAAVREYAATLAADVAAQPNIDGIELESCGWYGFDHLHAHDKTAAVAFGAAKPLLSLCFCGACVGAFERAGIDADELARRVRAVLDAAIAGDPSGAALPPELFEAVTAVRVAAAERFQREAVHAVRAERPGLEVLIHAQPEPWALGANPGIAPDFLYGDCDADGPVLPCGVRGEAGLAMVAAFAKERDDLAGRSERKSVVATVSAIAGMGADRDDLAAWCADLRDAGADALRFYHAGVAAPADLEAVRGAIQAL